MSPEEKELDLATAIKKAIADCEVSRKEYDQILAIANADSHIDDTEQALLSQLQQLIANGTVKRVAK
jgi:ABC-type nitrate/sulfonate/bicarbonate transport system substrate-binding protein